MDTNPTLSIGGETTPIGERALVMGILNVTPDSFSDGGEFLDVEAAVWQGVRMAAEGADWIDVGGESTRPGAEAVSEVDELRRVSPVLERLSEAVAIPISIDTYKAEIALRAVELGAKVINDVTGFRDPAMIEVAAGCDAACVCMHMKGTPATMRDEAKYEDVVAEMIGYFEERIEAMIRGGIDRERIVVDPGIGFAKKTRHNLEILNRLSEFGQLGRPVLLGVSRKRIVGDLTGQPERSRLAGTIAATVMGWLRGAHIMRVHDVGPIRDALEVARAIAAGVEA